MDETRPFKFDETDKPAYNTAFFHLAEIILILKKSKYIEL